MENPGQVIAVVEDNEAVRDMLGLLLESKGYQVALYDSAKDFVGKMAYKDVACILSDISMPGMTGIEMQRHLKDEGFDIPILFLTGQGNIKMAVEAMREGAIDFLEKPIEQEVIFDRISKAIEIANQKSQNTDQFSEYKQRFLQLTNRERDVLRLIVDGFTNSEISDELNIAKSTVEIHRSRVMKKMGEKNLAGLIRQVVSMGMDFEE